MTCSPARLAANRANAARSTGPRTAAGKAASRHNATRHGMAGAGDLLGPGEDGDAVARRAVAFAAELGVADAVGWTLARRAALLAVRLEAAAARDRVAVAAQVAAAQAEFDRAMSDDLAAQVAALTSGADPAAALAALEEWPAGLDHLITAWVDLNAAACAGDPTAAAQVRSWLGGPAELTGAALGTRIDAEIRRLRLLGESMTDAQHAIEQARAEAGTLASFATNPEATLARRYEAAAERGMYRALRAIGDHNRARGGGPMASPASTHAGTQGRCDTPPAHPAAPADRAPRPPAAAQPAPPRRAGADPLGSFRIGAEAGLAATARTLDRLGEPTFDVLPTRKPRPDLAKLARKRR